MLISFPPALDQYGLSSESESELDLPVEDEFEIRSVPPAHQLSQAHDVGNSYEPDSNLPDLPARGPLPLLQLADWNKDRVYDEHPLTCVHYNLKWKMTVNNKRKPMAEETELDLVLAPKAYWTTFLRPRLDGLVSTILPQNRSFRAEYTTFVLSVSQRGESKLAKRCEGREIDWKTLEKQLEKWSHLLRFGKKLELDFVFNYIEIGNPSVPVRRGTKRGYPSATQAMLAELDADNDTDADATGYQPPWNHVYRVMRCPGPPCRNFEGHCWVDRRSGYGTRHIKLHTRHLKKLIEHVQAGGRLETHHDVPNEIRDLLDREEQQQEEDHKKRRVTASYPPISITNVLPPQLSNPDPAVSATESVEFEVSKPAPRLQIPEPLDISVKNYTAWQQSRYSSIAMKKEFQKAGDATLSEFLDLELVYEAQDVEFYTERDVKPAVAHRFIRDIELWANKINSA
jgi:hypothetical protein